MGTVVRGHNNQALAAKFDLSILNRKGHRGGQAEPAPATPVAKG